jgi:hypothetical protein
MLRRAALALVLALSLASPALAGKGSVYSNDWLKLVFNATPIANMADNAATAPLTNLYVSLHTADPTAGGNQSSSEVTYTSYARAAVARTSGGWTVSTNTVVPAATVAFPAGTGGSGTATFWAVGTASSGTGKVLYSGAISPTIVTGSGVTPQLTTASTITEN